MEASNSELLLQRNVNVNVVVTPRWKDEAQQQLQQQLNGVDEQLQQFEMQLQQVLGEIQKQSVQPPGPETIAQMDNVKMQFNESKSELLEQKNQVLQQLQQVQTLELEQEVNQGQIISTFKLAKGDNLIEKMNVEVLLRDGIVEDIRGEL
ncbi:YlqD family protein [filamentous cyanobacterium LEGE 11480]|uniref:YlqD family protein n=1 Tax=Romeriopsis navalis LEGE 11480 TaxID=2777977 RepID=A0A928Z3A6_9CYAN|nr:YlqD family protein [Romeriopsis navalis]MBE9029120.1 YlqD family protein [Romeriopsis navalis LEGE 11480]